MNRSNARRAVIALLGLALSLGTVAGEEPAKKPAPQSNAAPFSSESVSTTPAPGHAAKNCAGCGMYGCCGLPVSAAKPATKPAATISVEFGATSGKKTEREEMIDDLVKIMEETDSPETVMFIVGVLASLKAPTKRVLPLVIRHADRTGVFRERLPKAENSVKTMLFEGFTSGVMYMASGYAELPGAAATAGVPQPMPGYVAVPSGAASMMTESAPRAEPARADEPATTAKVHKLEQRIKSLEKKLAEMSAAEKLTVQPTLVPPAGN